MNLSSEFRKLVLESECQVFVKGKHQVLVCGLSNRYMYKWNSLGTGFAKGVLQGTLYLQMSPPRYCTYFYFLKVYLLFYLLILETERERKGER